ncbi:holo-[acyl-carrier-protein] synthase KNAG_0I00620 [Huiozyma naganishii CBS 8797]|uniref:holo-[acyl-carrier-protein] synthase n=1 Tax=Huiozyma naganishii (strain ATCC MYA-139 / BCRC 22969 / CBS 8797 / KCTC 17520 / NBRC 10181 / NCYC 3082 / Yp74L-3) TaxID=1071383 RepID=J7RQ12_HUIN7|nr:hypothetical protein KNAG_0I00620 [Kazachstania naganishii CBS 8797]CCK71853.1 hypothetical protein KNAG_0I00620 [Kazachstania naganishii CBS 8797]
MITGGSILVLDVETAGLRDDFVFETAMRLLPLSWQTGILRKRARCDQNKALCNRLLQIYGCLLYSNCSSYDALQFGRGPWGKPFLINELVDKKLAFSMTNGDKYVAMYVACCPKNIGNFEVGIDIASPADLKTPNEVELYRDIFTEEEYGYVASPLGNIHEKFAFYWSLKECYTKYIGNGLNSDLKQIDFGIVDMHLKTFRKCINPDRPVIYHTIWIDHRREVISVCCDDVDLQLCLETPRLVTVSFDEVLKVLGLNAYA